jgi:hypothetical protein
LQIFNLLLDAAVNSTENCPSIPAPFYETDAVLRQYLLFHYGEERDLMPFLFGPQHPLHFLSANSSLPLRIRIREEYTPRKHWAGRYRSVT